MSDPVTIRRTYPPGVWFEAIGLWFYVERFHDPLVGTELVEVCVHRDDTGHAWVDVRAEGHEKAMGRVRMQSTPPSDGGHL